MTHWIKLSERKPEEKQRVLYYFDMVGVHIGRYTKEIDEDGYEHDVFFGPAGWLTDDVTHWMPIPEEPT